MDLNAVRERDPEALADFFDQYFPRVYQIAARWCGNRSDAEDLTQDVFLRVQRSVHTLDVERDPWPWLLSIARNRMTDWSRSAAHQGARRTHSMNAEVAPPAPAGPAHDPTDTAEQREQVEILERALRELPDEQRLVVLLRDFQGLSHATISEIAGMSVTAARKCYSRALAALGRRLRRVAP